MSLFSGVAPYYVEFRPAYSPAVIEPNGAFVTLSDFNPESEIPEWQTIRNDVLEKYLGPTRLTDPSFHESETHEEVAARSPFSNVERHEFAIGRQWTLDAIVGYLYSTSFASPARFGERRTEFEADLREALTALNPTGVFGERAYFNVTVCKRPQ